MVDGKFDPTAIEPLKKAIAACRGNMIAVVVFSFFINLLVFVGPLYMLQVYDRVLTSRNSLTLIVITGLAVALLAVYAALEVIRSRLLVRTGVIFDDLLSGPVLQRAFRGYVRRPGAAYSQAPRDVDAMREFVTGAGILAFCDAPWVPVFIAVCFMMHFWIGVVALVGALIILVLAIANEMATRTPLREASSVSVAANQYVSSSLRNAETVQAMGMANAILRRYSDLHLNTLALQARASDRAGLIIGSFKAVRMALQVAILGVGAYLVIIGQLSPGLMIAASIIMGRALAPVEGAVGQWKQFVAARAAYARTKQLLSSVPGLAERMSLPAPKGDVSVERLVSAPPGSTIATLKGVSFNVRAGEVIAVIGASGAGKSSLARALVGVWQPSGGTVRLDGAELSHWVPEELGPYIGYLPQEVELFAGTIAENIARFGDVEATKVVEAAKTAGAHEMILKLPDGYSTRVGEGGRSLSGGQRQRVALARALYGDPRLIVLDEPNSSLDQEGEKALSDAILQAKSQGRTVIVISHRMSLLSIVDRVLVLVDGTVAAYDRPDLVLPGMRGGSNVSPLRNSA
jgi:ATP-binding cassette subfamily C protein/ATP-binding cassette subfamily C protein EexD